MNFTLKKFTQDQMKMYFNWYKNPDNEAVFRLFAKGIDFDHFRRIFNNSNSPLMTICVEDDPVGFFIVEAMKDKPCIKNLIFLILKPFRGNGITTKICNIVADDLLKNGTDKVIIQFLASDNREFHVKQYGWEFEARLKNESFVNGDYVDDVRYFKMRGNL